MSNNKQSSVDKEFVPYEEAFALKELEFDEPCLGYYDKWIDSNNEIRQQFIIGNVKVISNGITHTPTLSQAFRFFREKFELNCTIDIVYTIYTLSKEEIPTKVYSLCIYNKNIIKHRFAYISWEEAELQGLKKLIEIVKGGNK
jgi:hypothetical protein